jgi:hypothetical protein
MTNELIGRFLRLDPQRRRAVLHPHGRSGAAPIEVRPRTAWPAEFPTTPGQESQFFLWHLAPASSAYHVTMTYDLAGPLDVTALRTAVGTLVRRHESLRTTFKAQGTSVVQLVHAALAPDVRVSEVPDRAAAVAAAVRAAGEAFDLCTGPLLRVCLWRYGPAGHLLLVALHHIVVDERSSRILERELDAAYRAALSGRQADLPPLPCQYGDFAAYQQGVDRSAALAYWLQRLAGSRATQPPRDHVPSAPALMEGTTLQQRLPAAVGAAVSELATAAGVSRFVAVAAVFAAALSAWTGERDLCFGTPVSGRPHPSLEWVVGYFLNVVPLRIAVDDTLPVRRFAAAVHGDVSGALRQQAMPYQEVVRRTRSVRADPSLPPFTVLLVYLSTDQTSHGASLGPDLTVTPAAIVAEGANFDLNVALIEDPDGVTVAMRYSTQLYEQSTAQRWIGELAALFLRAAAAPDASVGTLLDR